MTIPIRNMFFFVFLFLPATEFYSLGLDVLKDTTIPFDKEKDELSMELSVWPNSVSHTNSDIWLIKNHDNIRVLKPRVLVIDFNNKKPISEMKLFVDKVINAIAEGSRYHGYKDLAATPQLVYRVSNFLDLRDSSENEISTLRPHHEDGSYDQSGLFNDTFARYLGYWDSANSRYLRLGELFDKGIINACWIIGSNTIFEAQGRVRKYDSSFNFIGTYDNCQNGCYDFGNSGERTSATIRLYEINPDRGLGCATHAFGHGIEHLAQEDIPYLGKVSERFFNFNLNKRYGAPFWSEYDAPYDASPLRVFEKRKTVFTTVNNFLPVWTYNDWGRGCGNVHFPANATFQYDYNNIDTVECSCENYGMRNGPGGKDLMTDYSSSTVKRWSTDEYNDCGGEWQIYLRQNMPGYNSTLMGDDGKPMKSWWPFLFY